MPIRLSAKSLPVALCTLAACSAVGFELPNYGFYSYAPKPDGSKLTLGRTAERARPLAVEASGPSTEPPVGEDDPLSVGSAEVLIDSGHVGELPVWYYSRHVEMRGGATVVDSAILDRWTLRPMRIWHIDPGSASEFQYDRRKVRVERTVDRRTRKLTTLYDAEPYSNIGIELVIATMPLRDDYAGALPVLHEAQLDRLRILKFHVATQVHLADAQGVYRPAWVIEADLDGAIRRYWIDTESRAILRREEPAFDGAMIRWVKTRVVPRVELYDVTPLPKP